MGPGAGLPDKMDKGCTYLKTLKTADVHHIVSGFRYNAHHFNGFLEICRVETCPISVLQYLLQINVKMLNVIKYV